MKNNMDTEEHCLNLICYIDRFRNEDYVDLEYFPFRTREDVENGSKINNVKF